jgi:hypothetical protein
MGYPLPISEYLYLGNRVCIDDCQLDRFDPIRCILLRDTYVLCAEVENFLNTTTTYMDTLDWIERYAWFGYFVSGLQPSMVVTF